MPTLKVLNNPQHLPCFFWLGLPESLPDRIFLMLNLLDSVEPTFETCLYRLDVRNRKQ